MEKYYKLWRALERWHDLSDVALGFVVNVTSDGEYIALNMAEIRQHYYTTKTAVHQTRWLLFCLSLILFPSQVNKCFQCLRDDDRECVI